MGNWNSIHHLKWFQVCLKRHWVFASWCKLDNFKGIWNIKLHFDAIQISYVPSALVRSLTDVMMAYLKLSFTSVQEVAVPLIVITLGSRKTIPSNSVKRNITTNFGWSCCFLGYGTTLKVSPITLISTMSLWIGSLVLCGSFPSRTLGMPLLFPDAEAHKSSDDCIVKVDQRAFF